MVKRTIARRGQKVLENVLIPKRSQFKNIIENNKSLGKFAFLIYFSLLFILMTDDFGEFDDFGDCDDFDNFDDFTRDF